MIIALRGTKASGKSHLVRAVMALYPKREEVRVTGRRHPVGYKLFGSGRPLFVPGLYGTGKEGIDTLLNSEEAYRMIWEAYDAGFSVLYEGATIYDGTSRITSMFHSELVAVVIIDHLISSCVLNVRDRGGVIRVETIKTHARKIAKDEAKFISLGYPVYRLNRADSLIKITELLEIT